MDLFTVVVEKGESGYYIAYVPSISGCHTQAKTIPQLLKRVKEAIALCLECGWPANEETGVSAKIVMGSFFQQPTRAQRRGHGKNENLPMPT